MFLREGCHRGVSTRVPPLHPLLRVSVGRSCSWPFSGKEEVKGRRAELGSLNGGEGSTYLMATGTVTPAGLGSAGTVTPLTAPQAVAPHGQSRS